MPRRTDHRIEFGDFQTPDRLAGDVCGLLRRAGARPQSIIEPTCGTGSFLRAAANLFPECKQLLGFEINPDHVRESRGVSKAKVYCEDFFDADWEKTLKNLEDTILVIGNPPWVTNSKVGVLGGSNLPGKSNFGRLDGLDAMTGKSNFDISEWMMTRLADRLSGRRAILAMLCKTSVARKVLHHVWSRKLEVAGAAIHKIDANRHFGASVEACLLICRFMPGALSDECSAYENIDAPDRFSTLAFRKGRWSRTWMHWINMAICMGRRLSSGGRESNTIARGSWNCAPKAKVIFGTEWVELLLWKKIVFIRFSKARRLPIPGEPHRATYS